MKELGPLFHWMLGAIIYITLLLQRNNIRHCVNHIETDWKMVTRKKDEQVMLRNAKFGRYIAICCATFVQGGIMTYCLITASNTQIVEIGNETRIFRTLPLATYEKLIPVNRNHVNEIVIFSQFLSGLIVNTSEVGIFSLAAVLAAHACGQLGVLMVWIDDFVKEARNRGKDALFREIAIIVEHHLRVLDFISHIEEMMNQVCFLELFRCIAAICVLGYYMFMEWADSDVRNLTTYFTIFMGVVFNTFMLCYIGELLTEKCMKVGEVVYMTDWYYLPQKRILDLILIIARSSVAVEITAGKLIHMSVTTFGDVMKSGFAYLNMLCQMS
ncbi:Odorant receptor 4 [Anthophora retusa]